MTIIWPKLPLSITKITFFVESWNLGSFSFWMTKMVVFEIQNHRSFWLEIIKMAVNNTETERLWNRKNERFHWRRSFSYKRPHCGDPIWLKRPSVLITVILIMSSQRTVHFHPWQWILTGPTHIFCWNPNLASIFTKLSIFDKRVK